jgi:tRNA threonylcarbamoyladenosine biosynthesis protein TsaB
VTPVLAFETSSPVLSIALSTSKNSLTEKTVKGFSAHAENLIPVTDQLLKKKKTSLQKIQTLLIGQGPGSFTGLRVGYATLKGFLAAGKKECYGALSLDLIAENIELPEGAQLCAALDAHREKVYSRLYTRRKGEWKPAGKAAVFLLEDWLAQLPENTAIAGNAAQHYASQIETRRKKAQLLPEALGYPKASTLVKIFQENPGRLQRLEKPLDFLPLYFRLSEAEEKRRAHAHTH